jgi:hypothetical protein
MAFELALESIQLAFPDNTQHEIPANGGNQRRHHVSIDERTPHKR